MGSYEVEAVLRTLRYKKITEAEFKVKIWRYFMSYWNNRYICSTNGGLPPLVKSRKYYTYHEEIL